MINKGGTEPQGGEKTEEKKRRKVHIIYGVARDCKQKCWSNNFRTRAVKTLQTTTRHNTMYSIQKSRTPKLFIISEGSHYSLDSSPSVVGSSSSKVGLLLLGLLRKISGVISGPIAGMGGCSAKFLFLPCLNNCRW